MARTSKTAGKGKKAGKPAKKNAAAKAATKKAKKTDTAPAARKRRRAAQKTGPRKDVAKKAPRKPAKKPGKATAKKAVRKSARKASVKRAGKPEIKTAQKVGKAASKAAAPARKGVGKKAATLNASRPSAPAAHARKPLVSTSNQRKTARTRLAKRSNHNVQPPGRKIAIRTAVTHAPNAAPSHGDNPAARPALAPASLGFRSISKQDWPAVRRLLFEAFGASSEIDRIESLRSSRDLAVELAATVEGRLAGYIAFVALAAGIDGRRLRSAALCTVAVAGEIEGQGAGTRLVAHGLSIVRGLDYDAVFVSGAPDFFRRFGFSENIARRFAGADPAFPLACLEFEPGALRGEAGHVEWPANLGDPP